MMPGLDSLICRGGFFFGSDLKASHRSKFSQIRKNPNRSLSGKLSDLNIGLPQRRGWEQVHFC